MDKPNIDKVKLESSNIADENFEKLASLFPNVVTETTIDGQLVRAIDKDKLMQEINAYVLEGLEERYNFTWPDKRKSVVLANAPTRNTLRACKEESKDFDKTENLYIEGDNLEVLKLLRNTYLGQVKMIYIDPPYNTGKDFVYKDNFFMSKEDYLENSGQIDENDNKYFSNTETNGRFHTDWLNMMYPRLKMARDLLTDDGVIVINIDEHEIINLSKICSELFGEYNNLGTMIWDKRNPKGDSKGLSIQHEYILFYCKNKNIFFQTCEFKRKKKNANEILKKAADLFKKKSDSYTLEMINKDFKKWISSQTHFSGGELAYNMIDDKGSVYRPVSLEKPKEPMYFYDIIHPVTKLKCKKPAKGWRCSENTMNELLKQGFILFGKTENTLPQRKYLLNENLFENIPSLLYFGSSDTELLKELSINFDTPKVVEIVKEHIGACCNNNDIILDFFSGSATTAHAVMQLNAEDGGNRKYIMVQLPAETPEDSEARKAGYNTICEIGKERIRRAGEKIKKDYPNANIDTGFRVFKLDSSNMEDVYYEAEKISQQDIRKTISNIKVDRSNEDLLFQIILLYGIPLTCKIEIKKVNNRDVYFVDDTFLLVCFEKDIDEKTIEELAKKEPKFMVFNQNMQDSTLANIEQIFKLISPTTIMNLI